MAPKPTPVIDRVLSKCQQDEAGCWIYSGAKSGGPNGGYGVAGLGGRGAGTDYTHRITYRHFIADTVPGLDLDHACQNRACCNPWHLRQVGRKQNMENLAGLLSNNTSGARGVTYHRQARKWIAQVKHNNQRHYLGLYGTVAEAAAAVKAKRLELFTHNDADRKAS